MSIETITHVEHINDKLFIVRTTKSEDIKFIAGQFTMIGLPDSGSDIVRPYSIASGPNEDFLEFYSIKIPDGEFTEPFSRAEVGMELEVSERPVGTLMTKCLQPADNLWLVSTGTGLAPFISIVRDPATFEKFKNVYVTHTVRTAEELSYAEELSNISGVQYYPTVTRDPDAPFKQGRITQAIYDGSLFKDLGVDPWSTRNDRVMLCGSMEFVKELQEHFTTQGWLLGSTREPGDFLIERAFVS